MSKEKLINEKGFSLEVENVLTASDLEKTLRSVVLIGDKSQKPYQNSTIEYRKREIENLRPLSYYVLEGQVQIQRYIRAILKNKYGINLFDLEGMVDYKTTEGVCRIAPPIIERYFEPLEEKEISVIVDGTHRIWLAREEQKSIGVIEISRIPDEFPLVPLPLSWNDIHVLNSVPEIKRKYRFPNSDNPYFFYRDLSPLGSGGIRPVGSKG